LALRRKDEIYKAKYMRKRQRKKERKKGQEQRKTENN
jgi:hypothetical protein